MAKKIDRVIKLNVPAGKANPSPPIGPALGQAGLNIMEFCKAFNAQTAQMEPGVLLPTKIVAYSDRSFTFSYTKPTMTHYLKKAANLTSGSKLPGKEVAATITKKQVRQIAEEKIVDLNASTIEAAMLIVEGSARSMGLKVVEG
ncbi:MAG TPA: 50S ribosomal protein L11 [Alphaproteobacteria bacterium]|nr:50S ribosomal protein L11 [Alphaproteobacteria bacterium]